MQEREFRRAKCHLQLVFSLIQTSRCQSLALIHKHQIAGKEMHLD
jgi:hypothetical protein